MPRTQQIINAFENGEVSPSLAGRTETDQYPYFCSLLQNMIVHKHGGVFTRGGFHFVLETKYPQGKSRLIPFVYSASESYVLEFGEKYMRIFRNSGYLENIQGVRSFIGDGSSTKYLYGFPSVAEADIKIYKNGDELTVGTDYTVAPADTVSNQIDGFDTPASWEVNYADPDDPDAPAAEPWVLSGIEAADPTGAEPVLRQTDINIARGSTITTSFVIDRIEFPAGTYDELNSVDIPLVSGDDYITVETITVDEDNINEGTISFSIAFEDTSASTRTSDFFYEVKHNDKIIAEDVILAVGTPAQIVTLANIAVTDPILNGDTFTLEARAIGNDALSVPTVVGATSSSQLTLDWIKSIPDAKLNAATVNARSESDYTEIDVQAVGVGNTYTTPESFVIGNFPMSLSFKSDAGLGVTISDIKVINQTDGWEITFTTAPTLSDVIVVLDGSSTDPDTLKIDSAGESIEHTSIRSSVMPMALTDDVYEVEAPFTADQLDDLYYTQANDQLFICHYEHKPWRLTRYNSYDWRFEQPEMTGAPWEENNYSPVNGYPRCVSFFQERLWFASTLLKPQTFWGSRSADFYEFGLPAEADPYKPDDPVEYTLASYTQETIEWFSSERILVIGTAGTEHRLDPDQYIGADRLPKVSKMTSYGGGHQQPVYLGSLTCYVQRSGTQFRSFRQRTDSITEAYESIDLGWMAEHLFEIAFKEPTYALLPHAIAVMVRLDGVMLTATYDTSSAKGTMHDLGWSRQVTEGEFKSCCSIPNVYNHQIWAIVEREIDDLNNPIYDNSIPPNIIGYEKIKNRYVEYMDDENYLDGLLTYPPDSENVYPPIKDVGGLTHLEGKTVSIVADGALHPDRTVSNGQITLDYPAETLSIGLSFVQQVKMMPLEGGNPNGTDQGRQRRWVQTWANMLDSANPIINGKRPPSRSPATPMNTREPNKTGQVRSIKLGFDRGGQIEIVQDLPLYLHLLSLYGDYEIHSG